ncbi:uncharacterized protein EV420DRAFT_1487105 [Desarmillaria tabescens]|uniref:Uncharacterized protein n=1 Tax=Armillaria tabescens TaxID=1929756 RepID=A0AA39JB21_ARMTA|nr:uncharacterized protein EV420DRAFT_1487105 [Desarmillaria tabescens]KAK0437428.1 hypothetical protein EV420DRAFT_1487105 [Desarmillaria tabescens]
MFGLCAWPFLIGTLCRYQHQHQHHSLVLSKVEKKLSKLCAFGSGEKGQLGNSTAGKRIMTVNKTGFDIVYKLVLVKDLGPEKIMQLSSVPFMSGDTTALGK